jgi:hypothetical protein
MSTDAQAAVSMKSAPGHAMSKPVECRRAPAYSSLTAAYQTRSATSTMVPAIRDMRR